MRSFILALFFAANVTPASAQLATDTRAVSQEATPHATIVLIGDATQSVELSSVITELLVRQGVQPHVESRPVFEPDVWLDARIEPERTDASAVDQRVWVFVTLGDPQSALLYFRSPSGERFLLRTLALRAGLDEVGRELIARVIETSTSALLHSSEGLSREEARAGLAKTSQPSPTEQPLAVPAKPTDHAAKSIVPKPAPFDVLLGVRVLGHWTGDDLGARLAAGLEGGVSIRLDASGAARLRVRASLEAALPQQLESNAVDATFIAVPIRLGVDLGTHGAYVGLSTGFDIVHVDPERAAGDDLRLTANTTELLPSSRIELRYELSLGRPLWLGIAAMIDVPWNEQHYDVIEDGAQRRVASPWRVQPGLALTLGARP